VIKESAMNSSNIIHLNNSVNQSILFLTWLKKQTATAQSIAMFLILKLYVTINSNGE